MNIKLLILIGILPLLAKSQITITDNDMPNVNDIYVISIGNTSFSQSLTVSGANAVWDFSDLVSQQQRADTFRSVSATPLAYQFYFNNSFLYPDHKADYAVPAQFPSNQNSPVQVTEMMNYFKNNASEFSNVGFGANINGVPTSVRNIPVDVWYHFPMNYGNTASNFAEFGFSVPGFGYYGQSIQRYDTIDGYGTITTPYGTFQALRLKSTVYRIDTTYSDQFGMGTSIPRPAEIEYSWLANGMGVPVLKIIERAGNVTQVEYQDSIRTLSISENNFSQRVNLYPNPAQNSVIIEQLQRFDVSTKMALFTINGKEITIPYHIIENKIIVWTNTLSNGVYFVKVSDDNGKFAYKKLVIEK